MSGHCYLQHDRLSYARDREALVIGFLSTPESLPFLVIACCYTVKAMKHSVQHIAEQEHKGEHDNGHAQRGKDLPRQIEMKSLHVKTSGNGTRNSFRFKLRRFETMRFLETVGECPS